MGPTPFYGAGAEKPLQKADFDMKQTNICRLSGDITIKQSISQSSSFQANLSIYTVLKMKEYT